LEILSPKEAVQYINDEDTVVVAGTASICEPDAILSALEERYIETGHPKDLTEIHPTVVGDRKGRGTSIFRHPGMLKRIIGSSYITKRTPELCKMINDNKLEAYTFPMGAIYHLLRMMSIGAPGYITDVGIETFVDPRLGGGRLNECTKEDLINLIELNGKKYLYYKRLPIDVAIIRGTVADGKGNISMKEEAAYLDMFGLALAAKSSGGKVIAQVKRLAQSGNLDPRLIKVPSHLIDVVVVHPSQKQSSIYDYNPSWCGEEKEFIKEFRPLSLNANKVILRRAAMELKKNQLVNIGSGINGLFPLIAIEENLMDLITFSVEHGMIGGIPASAMTDIFPAAINPDVILNTAQQFSIYDSGILDISFLSFAEIDSQGNVNVSKFADSIPGCGGFIDITHKTKNIVFCSAFSAGGLKTEITEDGLNIIKEGRVPKIVNKVQQISCSGEQAILKNQNILYVTERAVFKLTKNGLKLVEIAPGIDLKKDILSNINFPISISKNLRKIDKRIFNPDKMGLRKIIEKNLKGKE